MSNPTPPLTPEERGEIQSLGNQSIACIFIGIIASGILFYFDCPILACMALGFFLLCADGAGNCASDIYDRKDNGPCDQGF